MNRARFLRDRRPQWRRFEELLLRADGPLRRLEPAEVSELSDRFRAVCYDLATVRSRDWGAEIEHYLNDLVVRAHGVFYGGRRGSAGRILRFFGEEFPRLLRANAAYFWTALALFALPLAISWTAVQSDPAVAQRVLPATILAQFDRMYAPREDASSGDGLEALAAGFYVRNNIGVAFRCFALGIFAGVGTAYTLVFNGIYIGTVAGYVVAMGHSERFLSFVVSHGSFELTAIVISGAAGLILGHAVIAPGRHTRSQALRRRGLVAVQLALGAAGMLALAAIIEGFWSPSPVPPLAKYVAGAVLWILVIVYVAAAGRDAGAAPGAPVS